MNVTWQKLLIVLTTIAVTILASIGIIAISMILYLTSARASSGYDNYISSCSTQRESSACKCIAKGLKADNTTDAEFRYLAQGYKKHHIEKKDAATLELAYLEDQQIERCSK